MSKITPYVHIKCNGNANDISGNDNHGTVYGASLTDDRFGHPNSAYNFDGTDDYIDIGLQDYGSDEGTLSIWFYITDKQVQSYLFGRNASGANEGDIAIFYDGTGKIQYFVQDDTDTSSIETTDTIPRYRWCNLICTRSQDDLRMYLNGKMQGETDVGITLYPHASEKFAIGASGGTTPSNYWKGMIDDIRLYSEQLTPTQVDYIYTMTKRKYGRR
jgi:hypothetical protein